MSLADIGRLSAREVAEWRAADSQRRPWREQVTCLLAQLCAMFYAANAGRDAEPRDAADFLRFATGEPEAETEQDADQQVLLMRGVTRPKE
jgi:hypothetical protein